MFKSVCSDFHSFLQHTSREVELRDGVLCRNVSCYVLIEELEHQRDTVGEYEVLRDEFKLIDVVYLEMLCVGKEGII